MTDNRTILSEIQLRQAKAGLGSPHQGGTVVEADEFSFPKKLLDPLDRPVFYGERRTEVVATRPEEPLFAFEQGGVRYTVRTMPDPYDGSSFHKLAFNSHAKYEKLSDQEAKIVLDVIESELSGEDRQRFGGTLTQLRRSLSSPGPG